MREWRNEGCCELLLVEEWVAERDGARMWDVVVVAGGGGGKWCVGRDIVSVEVVEG